MYNLILQNFRTSYHQLNQNAVLFFLYSLLECTYISVCNHGCGGINMNWKSFILGIGIGAAGGILLSDKLKDASFVSAEKVLKDVKLSFKKEGRVDGSWISMKPEDYQKHSLSTKVYKGGVSRRSEGRLEQYEFLADAYTGTVIDVYPLSQ
jgi:predicted small secreted protein